MVIVFPMVRSSVLFWFLRSAKWSSDFFILGHNTTWHLKTRKMLSISSQSYNLIIYLPRSARSQQCWRCSSLSTLVEYPLWMDCIHGEEICTTCRCEYTDYFTSEVIRIHITSRKSWRQTHGQGHNDIPGNFCRVILITCTTEASCSMKSFTIKTPVHFFAALARDKVPILFATI